MACHRVVLQLFQKGLVGVSDDEEGEATLHDLLQQVDPEALLDLSSGHQALRGARIRRAISTLQEPLTLPRMWVLSILLGVLRYVSQFLQAGAHAVRVRARRLRGIDKRAPVCDFVNPSFSPVVVAMQVLSNILACSRGRPSLLLDILEWMVPLSPRGCSAQASPHTPDRLRCNVCCHELSASSPFSPTAVCVSHDRGQGC